MSLDELLCESEELFREKNFSRLKWTCIKILEQDKDNEKALTYLAYSYLVREEGYIQILNIVDKIHRLYPDNYQAYNLEAMAYLNKRNFKKALECCDKGLKIKNYYWLKINRIESLICLDRIDEAFEFYKSSEIPNYDFAMALINCAKLSQLSKYESDMSKDEVLNYGFEKYRYIHYIFGLRQYLEKTLKQNKDDEIALTYSLYYHYDGFVPEYSEVYGAADRIHRLYPDNYQSYNVEAMANLDNGDFKRALECCEAGLKIKDYFWLRINMIEALICLDRIDEAFEFYQSSQIPNYSFTKALIHCEKYSKLSEYGENLCKDELVELLLDKCRYLFNKSCGDIKRNYGKILTVCDEIFKMDNDNEVALGYKILALKHIDIKQALECSNHAIKLYPNNFRFYLLKAEILHVEYHDVDEAIKTYEKAASFDTYNNDVTIGLVVALEDKIRECIFSENYIGAIDCCEKILSFPERNTERLEALFTIDSIVKKHDLEYEPSKNYLETLKLNRKIYDCLTLDVGEYGSDYVDGCKQFKDYDSFSDYLRDVIICLIELCPEGEEKSIKEKLKFELYILALSFDIKETAYDVASEYVNWYIR